MAVQSSSRKWMFIGVGVVAAAALVMFLQNYPPQSKDAVGTIGAAQRYHEPQITGADVQVGQDELTKWVQSDTFDRIVKDPQARKLFTDAAVIAMFNDAASKFGAGAANKLNVDAAGKLNVDAANKLNVDAIRVQALHNAAISDALRNKAFCQALMNEAVRNALLTQAHRAEEPGSSPD